FGGDYTRTERLEYEDDDYYYFVKAVPTALVTTSERKIKKINGEPSKENRRQERVVNYSEPLFEGETLPKKKKGQTEQPDDVPVIKKTDIDDVDFEKK